MDEQIAKLYEDARRFDEGEICLGEEYRDAIRRQTHLFDLLVATFGEGVIALLNDYTDTFYDEMECEAKHYFQEGFRAGQGQAAGK